MVNLRYIKRLKGNRIYFSSTPSRWVGISERIPVLKLTLTSGGGMGGSRWTRYIKPQKIEQGLGWYETVNGEEIMINGAYIVEVEKVDIITADYISNNSNLGHHNTLCTTVVYTDRNTDVQLISEYKDKDKWLYR